MRQMDKDKQGKKRENKWTKSHTRTFKRRQSEIILQKKTTQNSTKQNLIITENVYLYFEEKNPYCNGITGKDIGLVQPNQSHRLVVRTALSSLEVQGANSVNKYMALIIKIDEPKRITQMCTIWLTLHNVFSFASHGEEQRLGYRYWCLTLLLRYPSAPAFPNPTDTHFQYLSEAIRANRILIFNLATFPDRPPSTMTALG